VICQDETIAQRQIIISSIVAMSRGLTPRFPMIMTEKEIEQRAEAADLRLADAFRQRRLRGWPRRPPALAHMASKVQLAIISAAVIGGVASFRAVAQTAQSERQLNTVREIRASVRACCIAPTIRTAPQITVRLSLKQNGEILGRPLISYAGPDASQEERAALEAAVTAALKRCTPLPISDALGGIIAGRPINVKLGEGWRRRGARTEGAER